jgi:hypothetical protein
MAERCSGAQSAHANSIERDASGAFIYASPSPGNRPCFSRQTLVLEAAEHERRIGAAESK